MRLGVAVIAVTVTAALTSPAPTTAATVEPAASQSEVSAAVTQRIAGQPKKFRCAEVSSPPAAHRAVSYRCVIGKSVDGRRIVAKRQGNPASERVLVVSGQMHGEEWPGPLIADKLTRLRTLSRVQIWTVRTMNPDGRHLGRRSNSHGVNLNCNFPAGFRKGDGCGSRPLSEPESRAMASFLAWIRPDLVISFHGFTTAVDTTGGGQRAACARKFGRLANISPAHRVPCGGPCHGNMTDWYSALGAGVAFTVEMPRSSRIVRACGVPGRPDRATPIKCSAWASLHLARRLPN